jgi:glycosyltransferase involved in cell wall biosynthesis
MAMSVGVNADQLYYQAPGGIGTYVRELVPALARQDPSLRITLFHARFPGTADPPESWMSGFEVHEIPKGIRSLYPRWAAVGRPALPAPLGDLDILHATSPVAVPPAGAKQRLVVTVHDLAFALIPKSFPTAWRQAFRLGLRATIRRAHSIITPSRNTAEDLLSRTRVDPTRLHVVPLAVSIPDRPADPEPALSRLKIPRPYILYMGTLEPRKNLIRLIRAYRRVATSGIPHALVLAGPLGWHHQSLLREIALVGPGDVVLTGPVGAADRDALYRAASAFCYPSLYEGFGLPVLEALARGVPTVAAMTSSLPEVTGDAALGVDPRSVRDIAAAIQRVLGDQDLAKHLSRLGPARAERFSWEETARLTLQVYERAVGAK